MANGARALLPLVPELDLPETPTPLLDENGIEGWVGAILAAIAHISERAQQEVQEIGHMTAATKLQGGDLVSRLYKLRQLSLGRLDFDAIVYRQARAQLEPRHGDLSEVDEFASLIIGVVDEVTATMRAEAH